MTSRDLAAYSDPRSVLDDVDIQEQLTADEGEYRGYRSDWTEFLNWCHTVDMTPFSASAAAVSGYITYLAKHGAKSAPSVAAYRRSVRAQAPQLPRPC